jgi:hypothetical protein
MHDQNLREIIHRLRAALKACKTDHDRACPVATIDDPTGITCLCGAQERNRWIEAELIACDS